MPALSDRPLAFVDLETTGSTASVDRITEIAIVTLVDGVSQSWSQLVNPQRRIPEFITRLTGISDAMVAAAPSFAEIAAEVCQRLDGCVFVAHNARFDYGFLKSELRRVGIDFRAAVLCTVKLSRRLYPQSARHNLDSVIERHGIVRRERHRALGDALAIHDFWRIVAASQPPAALAAALQEAAEKPSLPPWLDATDVDTLPEGCGVYLFFGENGLPLYVGKSLHLRRRVLAHFAADHRAAKEMALAQQVRRIETIACAGEVDALLCEARLVKELQPMHNRQLRRNRDCCSWRLIERSPGHWQPELVQARDLERGGQQALYGLYSSARQARAALNKLAGEHALCLSMLGIEGTPGKACFAQQLGRCRGACVGTESPVQHSLRLQQALAGWRLQSWPFAGPALLAEGDLQHVVDHWCHLGSARDEAELAELLDSGTPAFDRDTYRILVKHAARLRALPAVVTA
ncbi:3'-5' exonuclease family protein [Rhodocyclus tenuis]|uniref:3'-5' exonuclease family protein n=1 Tax=Rhodocyclus tenuis TaxID=1066 RepID=UPI001907363F|nr:3'-5' exonuclease family protein [Rhodocyclus tenuis]MBK1681383.1 ethanolamine utilization protein [Rhodocyclus tenuis]